MKTKKKSPVVALAAADLHWSDRPPLARNGEPDWWMAMDRPLTELLNLQERYSTNGIELPILLAGDLFHKWNPSPELINWLLWRLQEVRGIYAIPGNHDLPYHSYKLRRQSAYWTLVEAKRITNIHPNQPLDMGPIRVHGFPCGYPVQPLLVGHSIALDVALCHEYVWTNGTEHDRASNDAFIGEVAKRTNGYDVVVFGDNHIHFRLPDVKIFNCGCFMRRRSNEINLRPRVGLIREDGTISVRKLDIGADKIEKVVGDAPQDVGLELVIEELSDLRQSSNVDFREAVERALDAAGASKRARRIALDAMGEWDKKDG